ncbi:hypothetical protein SBOR_5335 [Sclerotinia borealis F-4128]|uniref:Uncharacterized protein n=1 Tax=Sclerotinia borealis (strain F-4128) TaxID=1432307 RepID=W9CBW8_SCLBF|nr:hypothetical protein SBOR_5335 [Sclerotinia borealis F-4128]
MGQRASILSAKSKEKRPRLIRRTLKPCQTKHQNTEISANSDQRPSHPHPLPRETSNSNAQDTETTQRALNPQTSTLFVGSNLTIPQAAGQDTISESNPRHPQNLARPTSELLGQHLDGVRATPPEIYPPRQPQQTESRQSRRLSLSKFDRLLKELQEDKWHTDENYRIMKDENANLKENNENLQKEKVKTREECSRAVCALQEMAFKSLKSAKWLPSTNGKLNSDMQRLKREMKEWTRGAVKNQSQICDQSAIFQKDQQLSPEFCEELENVMVLTEKRIPKGLPEQKVLKIMLDALLAHHIFTKILAVPFFVLGDNTSNLDRIYQIGQSWNPKNAHTWRSDTLRLIYPETEKDKKVEATRLHMQTSLDTRADSKFEEFIKSPARHLFNHDTESISGLRDLYQQAASLSHSLWTRRSMLKISTLKDLSPLFDINDPKMEAHSMVGEDTANKLTGKPITVVVHPTVESYGTEKAENFETSRVWA